jgi:hypothetical protein
MRRLWFASLLAVLACSEPDTRVQPAQVNWMEWPAEVLAATPFTVRLVGFGGDCRPDVKLVTRPTVDESAVTFEPYFLVPRGADPCYYIRDGQGTVSVDASLLPIIAPFFDTRAAVPGLEALVPRTYEIRAGTDVSARDVAAFPIRTFGEVTVRSAQVATERINAGGLSSASRDSVGCVHLWPYGIYPAYVIENPPDTTQYWFGFVRGYLYEPGTAVCGESKVFHLVSRN